MRQAVLITYNAREKPQAERVKIQRALYGYTDYSKYGKYKYQRPGLLTKIPHLNPTQSCLIVKNKDAKEIMKFFRKHKILFDKRIIILEKGEKIG